MLVLLRPRWLIGHLLIIVMSVVMLNLASWQHDRLDERKAENKVAKAGLAAPAVDVDSVAVNAAEYSRVRVTGTWDPAHTVYRRYAIVDGQQGLEVLEPLRVEGGSIYVNLGFIPVEKAKQPLPEFATQQLVTIEGLVRDPSTTKEFVGPVDASPSVPTITEVDTAKLKDLSGGIDVAAKWIQLTSPETPDGPIPLASPDLSEGPHFSYMLQWIAFTITIIVGWCVLCWRTVSAGRR